MFTGLILTSIIMFFKKYKNKAIEGESPKKNNWGVYITLALLLGGFTFIGASVPKGTLIYEAIRLPGHYIKKKAQKIEGVNIEKISYGEHSKNYMLICTSETVKPYRNKIIYFIHGGGWQIGSPEGNLKMAEKLVNNGYIVLMPAYRKGPLHKYDDISADMTAALKATIKLRKERSWDNIPLILGGTSAGGNLAALLLYDEERLASLGIDQSYFSGLFSMAGALDLDQMRPTIVLKSYAGKPQSESFEMANPVCYIDETENTPVLCIQGDKDGLVNPESADSFVEHLKSINPSIVEYYKIKGATHLDITSGWYYKRESDFGQSALLLNWLNKL